ncbi:DUF421 domain-containing protein [Natranaerobius trueperi]|uniref:YetF C-terminal domain-containing protein n=1 Tax=Natranaerobius trueperi TaxID=759412 RepID=A0A226C0M7_9FIRM|nr:DUF421 domain-containing protein [Natranaerobius trueperi]OWZ84813.1 hypothetical protein CDO51_02000 [Natranaerobius trueperi]
MGLTIFIRTIIFYFIILTLFRIMGKREVGQLSAFDLVVSIMIAEISVLTIEDETIPIYAGIIPLVSLMGLEVMFTKWGLKNKLIQKLTQGSPSVLIEDGKIKEQELKKVRFDLNELMVQLRQQNAHNISEVEYAILEPDGQLSVIIKNAQRPVTKQDLNINAPYDGLPVPLIMDGEVEYGHLKKENLTEKWLISELKERGFSSPQEILYASLDSQRNLYVSPKEKYASKEKTPSQ